MAVDVKAFGDKINQTRKLLSQTEEFQAPRRTHLRPPPSSSSAQEDFNTSREPSAPIAPANEETSAIGLNNLPAAREYMCKRKGGRLSIVLAGMSGTGKTTFLNTLFGEVLEDPAAEIKAGDVREQKFLLTEDNFDLKLTVIDSPGFGSKIDNQYSWMPLVKYIDYNFRQYMLQEEQPNRSELQDNRVHVCLYFLQPSNTTLSPLDVESMKEIACRVNLIPLIGRSDTLNKDELLSFKERVNDTLAANGINICKFLADASVLEEVKKMAPYAIVGCNNLHENAAGNLVRARKYNWGMVEIENPDHCDFLALRDILTSKHMLDLILSTEGHYGAYRQRCLRERIVRAARPSEREAMEKYDDSESSGLESYKKYKPQIPLESIATPNGLGPEEDFLEEESKKQFEHQVRLQEVRFREWKARLLEKQDEYNEDLKNIFLRGQELCNQLARTAEGEQFLAKSDHEFLFTRTSW